MNNEKLEKMRKGGRVAADILSEVINSIKPGISTKQLDNKAEALCKKNNVKPAFKGYQNFPAVLCVGPNDRVVHGIPNDTSLKKGDILSIDFGIIYEGYYLDMARTIGVEEIAADAREFLETTRKALERATVLARPGNTVGDLGNAIESTVTEKGFSVVREMVGHGVGENLHEDPAIPGFGFPGSGPKLQKGQTIAVEAIINQGEDEIVTSREDNWTTWTKDGKLSALFENTIVVLETPEVLTQLDVDIVI